MSSSSPQQDDFNQSAQEARTGLVAEFWGFLQHSKKWWMLPVMIVLLLVTVLVLLAGSPAAPFVYSFF